MVGLKPLTLLLLLSMAIGGADAAQYPSPQWVTQQPAKIALPRPAYLRPTALPGLGTFVMRIADAAVFGGGQRSYRHYYSKQQPWNSDGTLLMLSHDSSRVYFLDGRTFVYLRTANDLPEYPKWSNRNPDLLFGVDGVSFVTYAPSTGEKRTVKTFSEFSQLWLGLGEGNLSDDDRYAPLVGAYPGGLTVVIYDTVKQVEAGRRNFPGAAMDWASLSPRGEYVVVNLYDETLGRAVYQLYDRAMNFIRTLDVYAGGHADIGIDAAGQEVLVFAYFEGGKGVTTASVRLADAATVVDQLPPKPQSGVVVQASNYHISCRNSDRPGYCYISSFAFNSFTQAYLFREVFALRLDGSGTVERFGQTFAAVLPLADLAYSRQSQGVPNRDGTLVLFASDWGDASSDAVVYDYVAGVQLPGAPLPRPFIRLGRKPLPQRSGR